MTNLFYYAATFFFSFSFGFFFSKKDIFCCGRFR